MKEGPERDPGIMRHLKAIAKFWRILNGTDEVSRLLAEQNALLREFCEKGSCIIANGLHVLEAQRKENAEVEKREKTEMAGTGRMW